MAHMLPAKRPSDACMQASKEQYERYRKMYGPSNSELLGYIQELQQQVKELSEKLNKLTGA